MMASPTDTSASFPRLNQTLPPACFPPGAMWCDMVRCVIPRWNRGRGPGETSRYLRRSCGHWKSTTEKVGVQGAKADTAEVSVCCIVVLSLFA